MKMEIPVLAESTGMVAEIAVTEGDVVQEGDLIARVGVTAAPISRPYVMSSTPGSGDQSRSGVRTKPSRR